MRYVVGFVGEYWIKLLGEAYFRNSIKLSNNAHKSDMLAPNWIIWAFKNTYFGLHSDSDYNYYWFFYASPKRSSPNLKYTIKDPQIPCDYIPSVYALVSQMLGSVPV